jgi:AmmeMemoRadiSam system protein B
LNSNLKKAAEWLTLYEPDYPEGAFKKNFQEEATMVVRRATHAGSWYTSNGHELSRELDHWLQKAGPVEKPARAIIGPHAGYRYCGACAAHCYSQIDPTNVKRVFILGPSHHYLLNGCAVSDCTKYATPLYDLTIDRGISEELRSTGSFEVMSLDTDEAEHSIEMHLPYIAKMMAPKKNEFTVVPILVGSISADKEAKYGAIFAKYLADPTNLFVISSDFCHWGDRFHYTYYDQSKGEIHQSIKALDFAGMEIIERLDHQEFTAYLKKYSNTICGRHPIGVFLGAINALRSHGSNGFKMCLKFRNYDQSNQCCSMNDSSVSYAAATFTMG